MTPPPSVQRWLCVDRKLVKAQVTGVTRSHLFDREDFSATASIPLCGAARVIENPQTSFVDEKSRCAPRWNKRAASSPTCAACNAIASRMSCLVVEHRE